jgi:Plasma-membrane choline transporter
VTIVKYYFSRDKSTTGAGTFFNALKIGFVYHMGTAAFGSLIIAIIQVSFAEHSIFTLYLL